MWFQAGNTEPRWWAVMRFRMEGKSFREIGRELGISQSPAWKLWQQAVEDEIEQAFAEREGQRCLVEACRKMEEGDPQPFRFPFVKASRRFGVRAATRFVGRTG